MNKSSTFAALDVGSSKVCCVIAKVSREGQIKIAGYGYNASSGIKNGIVTDINKATLAVCNAVEAAEQRANERISKIIVNVSGDKVHSSIKNAAISLNKNRPINEADLNKVLEKGLNKISVDGCELIHCLPTNYRLDGGEEIKDPRNIFAEKLAVDIVLGLVPDITYRNLSTVIENAHLEIVGRAFSSYASGLACLVEDEKEIGATVIDIGGGTTSIATFRHGYPVYFSALPVGGNNVTNDIAYGLTTSIANAERLKTYHGCAFLTSKDKEETINVYPVGEEDDAYLIIILYGGEGKRGGNLRHHVLLHLAHGAELQASRDIHEQHHRQLALLLEHLHVGLVEAGGHVPVYVAYVVAKLILAHLGEGHAPALEGRMILARKDVVGQSARLDFNLTDFL